MSNYPTSFDDNSNLYLVHDALRVRLAEDYEPGDTSIAIDDPKNIMGNFPPSGIITLTEQCSDIDKRALTFFYSSHTDTTFDGLEAADCFSNISKPKRLTDVTMNVMALHHNALKDAIIAIEHFAGIKGEISLVPLKGTMEARINFLRKLVLQPRAWFAATRNVGVVPLCTTFKDFSTRQPDVWIWDFGDGSMSTISRTQTIQTGDISKCYYTPGIYDVTLTVQNDFGTNTITLEEFITSRVQAPDLATIAFIPGAHQTVTGNVIRSRINDLINIMVQTTGQQALDPIVSYTWDLNDDLQHDHSDQAQASYSIGGLYDVRLQADTQLGAYRITSFTDAINVVEDINLWHFIFDPDATGATQDLYAYEFGLLSQMYKTANVTATSVTRDASFLVGQAEEEQQTREFLRNNGFSPKSFITSGDQGNALLFWSEGGSSYLDPQNIRFREYNAFNDLWITPGGIMPGGDSISRRWNWFSLSSGSNVYFLLGNTLGAGSLTNQTMTTLALSNYAVSNTTMNSYQNGAEELQINVGGGVDGDFSVYRATWKDSAGYLVRNDGTGTFFRLKSFYATEGTVGVPIQFIRKLTDMPGSTKFEGQFVPLTNGIYFFNNTGEIAVYNPTTNVWATGGPGVNSPAFSALQDSSVPGFSDPRNTLVAAGDGDHNAYLSYDYSAKAFLKFSEVDLTFTALPERPSGEQFMMGIY